MKKNNFPMTFNWNFGKIDPQKSAVSFLLNQTNERVFLCFLYIRVMISFKFIFMFVFTLLHVRGAIIFYGFPKSCHVSIDIHQYPKNELNVCMSVELHSQCNYVPVSVIQKQYFKEINT